MMHNVPNNFPQPVGHYFGDKFINYRIIRNGSIVMNLRSLAAFRNEGNNGIVYGLIHSSFHKKFSYNITNILVNDIPSSIIKLHTVTISPQSCSITEALQSFIDLCVIISASKRSLCSLLSCLPLRIASVSIPSKLDALVPTRLS